VYLAILIEKPGSRYNFASLYYAKSTDRKLNYNE